MQNGKMKCEWVRATPAPAALGKVEGNVNLPPIYQKLGSQRMVMVDIEHLFDSAVRP